MAVRRARIYKLFRETKTKTLNISTALVMVASSLGSALPLIISQKAGAAPSETVTQNSTAWTSAEPEATTTSGGSASFIVDASSPNGVGALHLTTDSTTASKAQLMDYFTTPLALSGVTAGSLSFHTKQNSASFPQGDPSYQIPVDLNGASGFDTLVFEPYVGQASQPVQQGVWQNWDVSDGLFYSTHSATGTGGSVVASQGSHTYTLSQLKTFFPDLTVLGIGLNVGSNNPSYDTEVSDISFNGTTYNFEPAAPATPANLRLVNADGTFACGFATNLDSITPTWDAVTDAASYNYKVTLPGGSVFGPINAGNVTSLTGPFGAEGLSTFSVQAVGSDGLTSGWATPCAVTYDTTAPSVPAGGLPTGTIETTNDFHFTWNASTDSSNLPVTYEFIATQNPHTTGGVLDTGVWDNIQNGNAEQNNLTSPSIHSTGAGNGAWYWQVRAIDAAGNKSAWSAVWNVTIDALNLSAPTLLAPSNGAAVNGASVTNTWSAVPNAVKYEYQSFNNAAGTSLRFDGDFAAVSKTAVHVANGTVFYWRVRAIDQFGQPGPWSNGGGLWKVIVDNNAPTGLANVSPADGTRTTTADLQHITWAAASDANGPVSYFYEVSNSSATNPDGSFVTPVFQSGALSTNKIDTPGTPAGTYYWHVRAIDAAGNSTAWTSAWKLTVDNTAPATPVATPAGDSYTTAQLVSLTSTDDSGNAPAIYYTTDGSAPSKTNGTLYIGAFTVNASETVKAIAYDQAGNASTVLTAAYTIITPPVITPLSLRVTPPTPPQPPAHNPNKNGQTTGTPGTTGQVLSDTTSTPDNGGTGNTNGKIKGDSVVNLQNASSKKNGKFLALGWWWLSVVAAIAILWRLTRRSHGKR